METPAKKVKLMGPVQMEFLTFLDQSKYFLDTYWSNWRNYKKPKSYLIPPVFYYQDPEVSNEAVQEVRKAQAGKLKSEKDHVIAQRMGDNAERSVYFALQQLVDEKVQAPLMVVHSLKIGDLQSRLA